MTYTADYLIAKRREKWEELQSIDYDKKLRIAIVDEMIRNKDLLEEVKRNPEKLIELVFIVVDKNQKTMPFFLNEVQHDFIDTLNQAIEDFNNRKRTEISLLVLKGRQQGFTTLVTAYQLSCTILNRNFQGYTLADKSDNAEAIFQNKAKFPYGQLPESLKPTEKFNNRKQFLFEKINSSWAVDTATKDVGRSRTVNFFHGSECAFWKDGIAPIQGALGEAFTRNCVKIYESTANGYNDYQKMWDSGVHINCFYEWWRTKELDTVGWTENGRISGSDGGDRTNTGTDVTGFIPCFAGADIYLKNVTLPDSSANNIGVVGHYDSDKNFISAYYYHSGMSAASTLGIEFDEDGNLSHFLVDFVDTVAYIRIVAQDINETSIITVEEEIE